jgi:ASCH domain-containing protein
MTATLSIMQPWAWAIVHGYKPVENRSWRSHHRGRLLIHAGKQIDADGFDIIARLLPDGIALPPKDMLPRGGVVGEARMTDCVTFHPSPWFFGRYGFVFTDAAPLPLYPCRGNLGFFQVDLNALPSAAAPVLDRNQRQLL